MMAKDTLAGTVPGVCSGAGGYDTHKEDGSSPFAGLCYLTLTEAEIEGLVKNPTSVPKHEGRWIIPSSYVEPDARSHEVQRERGEFRYLTLDIDKGGVALGDVCSAVRKATGGARALVYSSHSATQGYPKWRVLVPLASPLAGSDFRETQLAFFDLIQEASAGAVTPDRALAREGQLVYLPNRGAYYEHAVLEGPRLALEGEHAVVVRRDNRRKENAEAAAKIAEARAGRSPRGGDSEIDRFNAAHPIDELLEGYGYLRDGTSFNWRSPNQSSGTYATRDYGDHWVSLSGSDAEAGLGAPVKGEDGAHRFGDAFDLYAFYEHDGDRSAALAAWRRVNAKDEFSPVETTSGHRGVIFWSAADLQDKHVPPRKWLVEGLIPLGDVTGVSGDGGLGKSLLATQLGFAVSTGRDWLGLAVKQGPVLYLSAEDDKDELHRRLAEISAAEMVPLSDLDQLWMCDRAGEDAMLASLNGQRVLDPTPLFRQIERLVEARKPVLLILDTRADVFPGDENDRAQVRSFVTMLRGLAVKKRCAVVLLSHPSLSGMSSDRGDSGSTAWSNSVRSRLYLERDKNDPDQNKRVLTTKKANYGRTGGEIGLRWEKGVFVRSSPTVGGGDPNPEATRVFLKLLELFRSQGRLVSPNSGPSYAPAMFAGHPQAEGYKNVAFRGAMERLFAQGQIVVAKHGSPSSPRSHIEAVPAEEVGRRGGSDPGPPA